MPIHKTSAGKYGKHGHAYNTKSGAEKQMRAMFANGYKEKSVHEETVNETARVAGQYAVVNRPGHHLHDVIVKVTRQRGPEYYEVRGPNKNRTGTSTHLVHQTELKNMNEETVTEETVNENRHAVMAAQDHTEHVRLHHAYVKSGQIAKAVYHLHKAKEAAEKYRTITGGGLPHDYDPNIHEEVVTETLSKSATVKDWIDDFIKSKDPKFKNDSRKQRIRRAVAAYYGKQNEERALDEARINEATLKPGDRVVATKNSNGGFPAGRRTIPMVLKGHRGTYRGLEQGLDKPYHHIEWDHIGASDPMYHTPSEFKKA